MKLLKPILVIALLAMLLPCSHAAMHHDHEHDAAMELCALDTSPCECHSCEHQPCSDNVEIQLDRTPDSNTVEQPFSPDVLFTVPEPKPALRQTLPPVSGILASLQTVQLLI
ncbi:MAG: hypothetical protein ABFR33_03555 [Verrucomicrobiota bacterium]